MTFTTLALISAFLGLAVIFLGVFLWLARKKKVAGAITILVGFFLILTPILMILSMTTRSGG